MNKREITQRCIKMIDDNFFFKEGERERWDCAKKKLLSDVMVAELDVEVLEIIDNYLVGLNDPHTRLLFKETPSYILPYSFIFIHKKLYIEYEGRLKRIEFINQESIESIMNSYLATYKSFPLVLIENEVLKDIQFMKKNFSGTDMQITYDTGYVKKIYPINIETWKRNLEKQANNFQLNSVHIQRVDEECVCVKILTFRDKRVVSKILNAFEEIKGEYKTIIFDIRNNVGGYIEVAKELVSKIINNKVRLNYEIARVNKGLIETAPIEIQGNIYAGFQNKRIIVFVNYRTMSSAEYIFADALQLKGITIIGEETAGLKDQAAIIPISEDVSLQVTTKRYIQKGRPIQRGIVPDVFIVDEKVDTDVQDPYIEWYKKDRQRVI